MPTSTRTVYDDFPANDGAMHPKGTCSASLHCVGIAPYEMQSKLQTRGGFFLLSVVG